MKLRLGIIGVLFLVGALSIASFATTSATGSINVSAGGSSGSLGSVTPVSTSGSLAYVASGTEDTGTVSTATSITLSAAVAAFKVGDVIQWGTSSTTQRGYITAVSGATYTVADVDGTTNVDPTDGATVYKVLDYGTAPSWTPVLSSTSAVSAGDVYSVDVRDYTGNVMITLYVTNPDELSVDYTYLNQLVNVYVLCAASGGCTKGTAPFAGSGTTTQGTWGQATDAAGTDVATTGIAATPEYLSLSSGYLTFILKGGYEYAVSVDGGTGYTITATTTCTPGNGCLSPDYYLDLSPA